MLLAVDIGNTTIQAGVFVDGELGSSWRLATDHERLSDEYGILLSSLLKTGGYAPQAVDGAVISCVVPSLLPVFQAVCRRFFGAEPVVVGSTIRTGMRIRYEHSTEVGADRIVDAIAALDRHGPPPLIVVDFGTATVFDAIDGNGDYLGGAISPGVGIAAEALFSRASRLARVELGTAAESHRPDDERIDPVGHLVRLRGAGGGDHRAVQGGVGWGPGGGDGRLGGPYRQGDGRRRRGRSGPRSVGPAADLPDEPSGHAVSAAAMPAPGEDVAEPQPLRGRRIVLGVTGSISAYRAFEIARRLQEAGATVDVALTPNAARFAPAFTFRNLVAGVVSDDLWATDADPELHVALGRGADALVIAPASATTIAKLALGIGDNLPTLTALATTAPIAVAPAMDSDMYANVAVTGEPGNAARARGDDRGTGAGPPGERAGWGWGGCRRPPRSWERRGPCWAAATVRCAAGTCWSRRAARGRRSIRCATSGIDRAGGWDSPWRRRRETRGRR